MTEQEETIVTIVFRGEPDSAGVELLPCPFCGHTPTARNGKVKCANLQCKVQPKICAWYVNTAEGMANAARDWNARSGSNAAAQVPAERSEDGHLGAACYTEQPEDAT